MKIMHFLLIHSKHTGSQRSRGKISKRMQMLRKCDENVKTYHFICISPLTRFQCFQFDVLMFDSRGLMFAIGFAHMESWSGWPIRCVRLVGQSDVRSGNLQYHRLFRFQSKHLHFQDQLNLHSNLMCLPEC